MAATWLPAATSILALVFAVALLDQWRERRQAFQLVWAIGMLFYGVASGVRGDRRRHAAGTSRSTGRGTSAGALWTAGWLGLGTAFLLGRTRFGYTFALCLSSPGVFTLADRSASSNYAGAGTAADPLPDRRARSWPRPSPSRPTSRTIAGRGSRRAPSSARPSCRSS